MRKYSIIFLMGIIAISLYWGCSDNDNGTKPTNEFTAEQKDLNEATNEIDLFVLGDYYGTASIAHNGNPDMDAWDTYRSIYANRTDFSQVPVGTIVTKRTYLRDQNGEAGDIAVTFAMIKREEGYDPGGENWEYAMMPNDGSNDYSMNPNGMLPPEGDQRGILANCKSCHSAADDGSFLFIRNRPGMFTAEQKDIDEASNTFELGITGTKYGSASVGHAGNELGPDETFRDVYTNMPMKSADIKPGDVIIKHTFDKDGNGNRNDLLVTFAMIKREEGYNPDGGDWEYVMMPNDGSNNYDTHPNGKLPPVGGQRGKLQMCAGCHSAAEGGDFLFVK